MLTSVQKEILQSLINLYRNADASIKGEANIDVFTLMGGMSMRIPEDWLVIIDVSPFMGGYDDKTRHPIENTKRLLIRGTTIMGGIEIKN